jgi:hypothetical protein
MKLAALLVAAFASACSPILTRKAPSEPEPLRWPRCTEHRLYPLADLTVAILAAGLTYSIATSDEDLAALGYFVSVPMMLGYAGSSIYGFNQAQQCAQAREAYEAAALQGR